MILLPKIWLSLMDSSIRRKLSMRPTLTTLEEMLITS
ncbi:Non-structural protein NS-S [Bienertia sinuspersici]